MTPVRYHDTSVYGQLGVILGGVRFPWSGASRRVCAPRLGLEQMQAIVKELAAEKGLLFSAAF